MAAPVQCVHHKHVAGAPSPVQSCVATRYTVLTPAPADLAVPEPVELTTLTRYAIIETAAPPCGYVHTAMASPDWWPTGGSTITSGGSTITSGGSTITYGGSTITRAPEIDPSGAVSALTILAMSLAVIRSKR